MTRFHSLEVICFCVTLFLGGIERGWCAPPPSEPPASQLTPFERNNSIFTTSQQAESALDSPDPLTRRSGIEWLGMWTGTYTTYGVSPNKKNCDELYGQKSLVPSLERAVREMPADDRRQAARLLILVGPAARPAIPAVCIACVTPSYGESEPPVGGYLWGWPDILFSLTNLCGGTHHLAPVLTALMQDREPRLRWAAAVAAQSFYGLKFNSFLSPGDDYWMTAAEQWQWEADFRRQMMPVLAARVHDNVTKVRLAALTSLNAMTYDSADAPWQTVLPSVSSALSFPEADQRLVAAQILAYVPTDVSPFTASLRAALHRNDEAARPYIITALRHAAWFNPDATLDVFLPDLLSTDVQQRRAAAADIFTEGGLWNDNRQPGYAELLTSQSYQNMAYMSRLSGWSLEVDRYVPPSQAAALYSRRHKAAVAGNIRLLAALVQATADPDHSVRTDAALTLEQIGEWDDGGLSRGSFPNPAVDYRPQVEQALMQAAEALKTTEPALAKRLLDLNKRIETSHATA